MLRKWNKILSFILAIALVFTTINSNYACARVFAEEGEDSAAVEAPAQEAEAPAQDSEPESEPEQEQEEAPEEAYEEPAPEETPEEAPVEEPAPEEAAAEAPAEEPAPEAPTDEAAPEVSTPVETFPEIEEPAAEAASIEASDETEEAVEASSECSSLEDEEEEKPEKKEAPEHEYVTIHYTHGFGGRVTRSEETVDIADEDAEFKGSTAIANNQYYQFVSWVDEDGNTVCSDSEFIPTSVEEDSTYKATFMKLTSMPEQSFNQSAGGMNVFVSADEGVFPEGTQMIVTAISDADALDAAQDAMGENVTAAKGVDITFKNAEGIEIEPADSKYVHVSISLASALEGDSFSVVHKDDEGNAEVVADAHAQGADFETNSFSVYIVAGENQGSDEEENVLAVANYIFYAADNTTEFANYNVKENDVIANPGVPSLSDNQEFLGWFIDGNESKPITFNPTYKVPEVVSGATVKIYPSIKTTYYITFFGVDGEIHQVARVEVTDGETPIYDASEMTVSPSGDTQAFKGWAAEKNSTTVIKDDGTENHINAQLHSKVYPVIVTAYWVRFYGNGDGSTYTGPQYLESGHTLSEIRNKVTGSNAPTRLGYEFKGWSKNSGENNTVISESEWSQQIQSLVGGSGELYLYASWGPVTQTKYTIIIWEQNVKCNGYDFVSAETLTGSTGDSLSYTYSTYNGRLTIKRENSNVKQINTSTHKTGFSYDKTEIVDGKGNTVTAIGPKGDTVINVYFNRKLIKIKFDYTTGTDPTYQGYYGQTFSDNSFQVYTWPSGKHWYEGTTYITFLDTFLEDTTLKEGSAPGTGVVVYHYKQTLQGTYDKDHPDNQNEAKKGSNFNFTEKYKGFKLIGYSKGSFDNTVNNIPSSNSATVNEDFHIRHKRNKYNLKLINVNPLNGSESDIRTFNGIYFEQKFNTADGISGYIAEDYSPAGINYSGYKFKGWYKDSAGTVAFNFNDEMPALADESASVLVYGIWTPIKHRVTLDPNGGSFVGQLADAKFLPEEEGGDGIIRYFNVEMTEPVSRDNLENGVTYNDNYRLVGWVHKEDGSPFAYGTVVEDVNLIAIWRYAGVVKIMYDAGDHGGFDSMANKTFSDDYSYATDSAAVVAAPPSVIDTENGFSFVGWAIDGDASGKTYYYNNNFTITNDMIDAGTTIDGIRYVVVRAIYLETGSTGSDSEMTTITYDPNGGEGSAITIDVKVNERVVSKGAIFTKPGHKMVSWNTMADGSGEIIPLNQEFIAADNLDRTVTNTKANILYAQYQKLSITVTVKGNETEKAYTGVDQTYNEYSIVSVVDENGNAVTGFTKDNISYTGTGASGKDAGDYTYTLNTSDFSASSSDYAEVKIVISTAAGENQIKLTITPASATIKTGSDSKPYDGTPLTKAEASITGLVNGETATVTATGTITDPGTTTNTYTIDWGTTNKDNYTVTEDLGTLEITVYSLPVVLTAPSDSKTYDGTALTADGTGEKKVTATGLPAGYTVEATASGSQTDAGSSDNVVNDGFVIKNASGVDETASFLNVTKAVGTLTVNKAPVTVTTGSASKLYDGTALTKAEASITGLVNNETATVIATGSQTEIGSSSNTYSITWGTTNKDNYTVTENLGTLTVTVNNGTVTLIAPSDSKTYDGTALTADGTGEKKVTATGLPEGFTVEATASGSQTVAGSSANVVNDGYVIKNQSGVDVTAKFTNVSKSDGTLTVNKATVTITTGSATKAYDGTAVTNSQASISGLVNGETATVTATGSQIEEGSSDNTYSIDWGTTNKDNYTVSENLGTLTITVNSGTVTLTAPSDSKTYDGTALTADGTGEKKVTATGLPEGFTVEATATGSQTVAGSSDNVVNDGFVIKNAAGTDVTALFTNVGKATGTLTVNPAPVTITTGSASKAYDGTAVTNAEASITGLVNGETAAVTATGSQINVGSSSNTYSIDWGTTNKDNYSVTESLGTLTITEQSGEVKLIAPSAEKVYDGTPLTADGTGEKKVTAVGLPEGFTVEATASGSQTNAGSSANTVNDGYVIKNKTGDDVTNYYTNISKEDGTLTVNPASVTVTTGSASKPYDATPLTKDEASITGLVNGETATVTATGTITDPGTADNTYSIDWGTTNKDNYSVTENLGTLEITVHTAEVTLTAPSASKTYDGTALTEDGKGEKKVTATGLPDGYTVEATASGSQTDAGSSANTVDDGYVIKNAAGADETLSFTYVTKANGTLTVNPAPATITTGSDSKAYDGTALTKDEAGITGLVNNEKATVTATGSQTEIGSSSNTYSIDWGTTNKDNYAVTENLGTLTITANAGEVVLTAPSDSKTYDGTALIADGTGEKKVTAAGLPENFTVEATATGSQTKAGSSANVVNDGFAIKNQAGVDVTERFTNVTKVDGTLTVNPASVTIETGTSSKPYDGNPLTNDEATITGLVNGETATVTATGSQTEIGSSDNTYSIDWGTTDKDNYTVTENLGTLTITANNSEVKLIAPSAEKEYDGTPLTLVGMDDWPVVAEGLPEDFTVEATASGSQTDAGSSANVVDDGYVIKNAAGDDVTAKFTNVSKVDGTLTVTKAKLVVTTESASKMYDGDPLTAPASLTGLVNNETATVTATGTITQAGSTPNTYKITWGIAKEGNYQIEEHIGTLVIKDRGADAYVIRGNVNDVTRVYTGETYKDFDFSISPVGSPARNAINSVFEPVITAFRNAFGLVAGASMGTSSEIPIAVDGKSYTVSGIRVATEGTDAGRYPFTIDASAMMVKDAAGNNVTAQFKYEDGNLGTLTIEKVPLSITTGSASKKYDKKPLISDEATIAGLVNGETATVRTTGSQTEVGSSSNTYVIEWGTAKENNYSITDSLGTLTVTRASTPSNPPTPPTPPTPPSDEPTVITDEPTPMAPTPAAPADDDLVPLEAVLGARRETTDGRAVLGARRAKTEDETDTIPRIFAIIVSAAVVVTLILVTAKKKEDEDIEG